MHRLFPSHGKPSARIALIASLAVGLLAMSATSALASDYADGSGGSTAVSVLDQPPIVCAQYSLYNADLTFASSRLTAHVSSGTRAAWGEEPNGTHLDASACSGAAGQQINGFTGTLVGGSVNCTLGNGTYQRGALGTHFPELNIKFTFSTTSGTCTGITTPVTLRTTIAYGPDPTDPSGYIAMCNSPIAPQSCVLKSAQY